MSSPVIFSFTTLTRRLLYVLLFDAALFSRITYL